MKHLLLTFAVLLLHAVGILAQNNLSSYNTDRGFKHPGGLHTQEDFDRVKRQLAEKNEKVTQAYQILKTAAYAQPGVQTSPVETIVRGGGSGENYINAARGATMAYQNALRWKIEGNTSCANAAVRILMAWANTTKDISGNSDQCLAVGLYGYQFAQAAELMRDYEGWSRSDFEAFKKWMLDLWYPKAIGFLRYRNGTWENTGKWWQAPGHYWSNWGLCNVMCVISIGILCDDVFIYNQGMSYFKYDQVGTFRNPRTATPILNDGLTEFLGNLVVTTTDSDLETGAYGQLGQMNESGRDTGHSAMALGLAIDIAKVGWNQGDDLFAYMNHRLAAGIEFVAAQTQSVANLPWTNYHYGSSGYYYSDSRAWLMTEPALGAQMRPYWGTVIGLYEGVKGVKMPFSETSYENMGIDAGGQGSTSGGYDHLGYSVLMNTRDVQLAPANQVPTELSPQMEYSGTLTGSLIPSLSVEKTLGNVSGKVTRHNELGGLVNTYTANNKTCLPKGQTVKLMPQLPAGEEDSGLWSWNTGETTRDITVTTDKSYLYRVTYTNSKGVKSEQVFSIAVEDDNIPSTVRPSITYKGTTTEGTEVEVFYGESVTLAIDGIGGYGTYKWNNGKTTSSILVSNIHEDQDLQATFTNQGGTNTTVTFHIKVKYIRPDIAINSEVLTDTLYVIANTGDQVEIGPFVPSSLTDITYEWSNGATTRTLSFPAITTSGTYDLTVRYLGKEENFTYQVFVKEQAFKLPSGTYLLRHIDTDTYMTSAGNKNPVTFQPLSGATPSREQLWRIVDESDAAQYTVTSVADSCYLSSLARLTTTAIKNLFRIDRAAGLQRYAFYLRTTRYMNVTADGTVTLTDKLLTSFPFEFIPYNDSTDGISTIQHDRKAMSGASAIYDLLGRRIMNADKEQSQPYRLRPGVYVVNGRKVVCQ